MRKLVAVFFLLLPVWSFAQFPWQARLDSLRHEVQVYSGTDDTSKVLLLNKLAEAYFKCHYHDSGMAYCNQAIHLAEQLQYKYGLGISYLCLGKSSGFQNYTADLQACFKALELFEQIKNDQMTAEALGAIGGIYYTMERYPQALEYFEKERKVFGVSGNAKGIASAEHSIGGTYQEMDEYSKALEHESKALAYFERVRDTGAMASSVSNMANSLASLKEYNKALAYAFRGLRFYHSPRYEYMAATIRHDIGYIYFTIAHDSVTEIHADSLIPAGRKANLAKAISYFKEAYEIYRDSHFIPLYSMIHYSDALAEADNTDEALKIYKHYTHLKDSTLSNSVELNIAKQETKREADLRKREAAINELEQKQKKAERLLFAAGLVLLGVVIVAVYRGYRTQRNANVLQQETLRQKDMLMKEIHHRVKNNLQVIGTLLDLQLENIDDAKARKALTEGMSRIKSISLIHQQLYQNEDVAAIEFSKFAKDLFMQVTAVFRKQGQQISLVNDIGETFLDIDTAVPLGLIINELMTNSYKYAFANGNDGNITMSLEKTNECYELTYTDSGPGLPADIDIAMGASLGMMIIDSLSGQLGGSFKYDRGGKRFIINFKDAVERKKVA